MSALTFRNRRGETVPVSSFSATDAKNGFGRVLETAFAQGMVAITKRDETKAVLLSLEEYRALVAAQSNPLDTLSAEFDGLLADMQTPRARAGMRTAFDASPVELGKAAVRRPPQVGSVNRPTRAKSTKQSRFARPARRMRG